MEFGQYRISIHHHGLFRLDGGAMFGSVPKTLWSRLSPPDDENRILLATQSLVIDDGERRMLVDVGCGDKWNPKTREIFCLPEGPYAPVAGVTDVLLTHLHFDHAGGVSRFGPSGLAPSYPEAVHYVSEDNFENARHPNLRERASYLAENVDPLTQVDLRHPGDGEAVWPGLTVHLASGHTRGLMWLKLTQGPETIAFLADICPTSKHLPIPYVMGYDMCAELAMREKQAILTRAAHEHWILVFEHDPELPAARIALDDRGRPVIAEPVDLASH